MSEPIGPGLTDQVAEQAADWFVRLQSERAGDADWLAFGAWLEEAPEHLAAYERLERLSLDLDEVSAVASPGPVTAGATIVPMPARAKRPRPEPRWMAWGAAAAAALALAVFGGVWRFGIEAPKPAAQTYATAKGQLRSVRLADGSRVDLDSASSIRVAFEPQARRVAMGPGEAIFDVAKDPARPFLISVGDREVRVVGTEFNILRLADRTIVTVRRGVVAVGLAGAPPEARLVKGQQLEHQDGQAASVVRPADPEQSFAWRSGRIIYDDKALDEVAADLNRRFSTPIRMGSPAVGQLRFSGVLIIDSEDAVVRRLQDFLPVRAEQTRDAIVLWPAAR